MRRKAPAPIRHGFFRPGVRDAPPIRCSSRRRVPRAPERRIRRRMRHAPRKLTSARRNGRAAPRALRFCAPPGERAVFVSRHCSRRQFFVPLPAAVSSFGSARRLSSSRRRKAGRRGGRFSSSCRREPGDRHAPIGGRFETTPARDEKVHKKENSMPPRSSRWRGRRWVAWRKEHAPHRIIQL